MPPHLFPFARPLALLVTSMSMAACGGGSATAPSAVPSPSPAASTSAVSAALARLDAAGALPSLDRGPSIAGPDTDGNGVRDDVDAAIAQRPDTPPQKTALRQLSRALGTVSTADLRDDTAVRAAAAALRDAVGCVWAQYPDGEAEARLAEMRALTVNTRNRHDAYVAYNLARDGAVVALTAEARCE